MKMVRLLGWSSSSRRLSNLILGWLWLSNIICSVTAQTSNTSDQSDNKQKDLIVILVFFGVLILAVIGIIVFYVIRYKTQEPELRLINQLNIQKEVEHLAENMVAQLGVLLRLPWRQPRNWRWNDWASWLLLLLFIGSGVALIVGVALPDTDDDSDNSNNEQTLGQLSKRSSLLLVSAFGFVMSVNLFLITRQHLYYKCKREAFADDARFRAISETSFGTFDRASWYNRIQILVIAFEFFQLISFPLRDLLQSNRFSTDETASPSNATKFVDAVIRIVALLPQLSSVYFYVQFWTITGGIILGLAVAFLFHLHNKYARLSWPIFWVSSVVPIVGVLYLPVMTTYINSVACLTKHAHESLIRTQRCPPPSVYANFYLLFSLLCYIIAYLFLTVFLTSYDRTPVKGDISFKSSGVAFFDNLGK
ncbi:hypothetical protein BDF19DRAFT_242373 [Syncephalis fuscata]|nr:hypothetical protein BDF19DRAFT_242373 [Syncephalis fuscata]